MSENVIEELPYDQGEGSDYKNFGEQSVMTPLERGAIDQCFRSVYHGPDDAIRALGDAAWNMNSQRGLHTALVLTLWQLSSTLDLIDACWEAGTIPPHDTLDEILTYCEQWVTNVRFVKDPERKHAFLARIIGLRERSENEREPKMPTFEYQ